MFVSSAPPDITEGLPFLLSARGQSQAAEAGGVRFDVSIGGVSFLLAASDNRPYIRQSAPLTKQQIDTSKEPGEQTLDQYWVRSQSSWHWGAGVDFYEPGSDQKTEYRFKQGVGVDVWTLGQTTLLHRMDSVATVTAGQVAYATTGRLSDGTDCVFTNEAGTIKRRTGSTVTAFTGTGAAMARVAVCGSQIVVGTANALMSGAGSGSTLTNLWTAAPAAPKPYWVKSRIIASAGAALYELTLAGGTWPATPLFTHPDSGWTWTSIVESPRAILAAGYGGGVGSIFAFTLQDAPSGSLPELSQAYEVATFPPGEEVHSVRAYLGKYVAIGTSKGLRIGILSDTGTMSYGQLVQYGPLIVRTTAPVRSLTARDSFVYAGVEGAIDGGSGVVRVNLAEAVDGALQFPWSWDVQTHDVGQVDSVAFLGNTDRVALGVLGKGIYLQSDTYYEPSGYLLSGGVRFATTEPKAYRKMDVRAQFPGGSIEVDTVEPGGNTNYIILLSANAFDGLNIALARPETVQEFLSFKLTFKASPDGTASPVLNSLSIKALPVPKRQRMVQFPLLCSDREVDARGVKFGHKGYAWTRIAALESVEEAMATVQVQDYTNGETFDAVLEGIEFQRTTPRGGAGGNFGGYLKVTARRL